MDRTRLLPEDVLLDILRRLLPCSLAVSRCVCKVWRATVDGHLADLLVLSLEGIFLELYDPHVTPRDRRQEHPMPVLFSRPSTGRKIPADIGYPDNFIEYERSILDSCNGLVLLRHDRVVNPATRQWAQLPQRPGGTCVTAEFCVGDKYFLRGDSRYLVFDPTISPHYEVFLVSEIIGNLATGHIGMDVFSSRTGEWEKRLFVWDGNALGTVPDCNIYASYQAAAYWHGALYISCEADFVVRFELTSNIYQVIEHPQEMKGSGAPHLGKSEKGMYCAYHCAHVAFQIWFLDESRGQMEWVLKSDINVGPIPWRHLSIGNGSWILQEYDDMRELVLDDNSEWDPVDESVGSTEDWVGMYNTPIYDFLGFHPFKEIALLVSDEIVMAYHLNTSKVRVLGYINKGSNEIQASFLFTPCWMGPLPGASEHLIYRFARW